MKAETPVATARNIYQRRARHDLAYAAGWFTCAVVNTGLFVAEKFGFESIPPVDSATLAVGGIAGTVISLWRSGDRREQADQLDMSRPGARLDRADGPAFSETSFEHTGGYIPPPAPTPVPAPGPPPAPTPPTFP